MGDGDGWVRCAQGHEHWGRFGAAGLLLRRVRPGGDARRDTRGDPEIVLQHRAPRTHEGGTWGVPGGARDSHEDAVTGARREAAEEAAIEPGQVTPTGLLHVDHGGWGYTTVVADAIGPVQPRATNFESLEVRWWPQSEVDRLPLHPGFAAAWPRLRHAPPRPTLIIDAANVVGSRPDGWWHDRAGATRRLRVELTGLARTGLRVDDVLTVDGVLTVDDVHPRGASLDVLLPRVVVVVEGAARAVADDGTGPAWFERAVDVRAAPRDGDTAIVEAAERARTGDGTVLVITADRGLRDRLPPGVRTEGPRWLFDRMPDAS